MNVKQTWRQYGTVTLLFCVTSVLFFSVKKASYITSDGISKTFSDEDMG